MPDDPAREKKDELLRLLSDVEPKADRLEVLGQDIVRAARLSREVAGPIREIVLHLPADDLLASHWERHAESWRAWHRGATDLNESRTMVNSFVALSKAATSSGTELFATVSDAPSLSPGLKVVINKAAWRLRLTLERSPLVDDARSSMQRLGLDSRRGSFRTPVDLLDEAHGALAQGGGPVSVLVALRECMNSAIAELVRRRPIQEVVPKLRDKVVSVGRQCARPGLGSDHFERLGADGEVLHNTLSTAKQADMSREEQAGWFNRGLAWLDAFMASLNETRLKPP